MSVSITESKRDQRISAAITWAQSFITEATRCLSGLPHQMPRAAAQTVKAIEQIDPIGDFTADGTICTCTNTKFWHLHERDECLQKDCGCHNYHASETELKGEPL